MTRYEVGPKIAAFCYGYEMVLVAVYEKENVDEELGKLARGEPNSFTDNELSLFISIYVSHWLVKSNKWKIITQFSEIDVPERDFLIATKNSGNKLFCREKAYAYHKLTRSLSLKCLIF